MGAPFAWITVSMQCGMDAISLWHCWVAICHSAVAHCSPGCFDSGLQLVCIDWSDVTYLPLDNSSLILYGVQVRQVGCTRLKLGWEKCEREIRWKKKKTRVTRYLSRQKQSAGGVNAVPQADGHHGLLHEWCEKKAETKTEETHLLLNTHAVKCNGNQILCIFLPKTIIAPILYYNQQKLFLLYFKRVNVTVFIWLERKKKTVKLHYSSISMTESRLLKLE